MASLLARWLLITVAGLTAGNWDIAASAAEPQRVKFDFEDGTPQGWRMLEGKFGDLICSREFFFNQPKVKYNKQGKHYLSTLESGGRSNDPMTGVIDSPVFVLQDKKVSFLVGGGAHVNTYVAICTEDTREILRAHGKNSETMQRVNWELPQLVGKRVFLRVVDHNSGSWGHVTFDDLSARGKIDPEATKRHFAFLEKKRLEARRRVVENPLLCKQPIVFVVRQQYKNDHHNTATMFQTGEINEASFRGGSAIKTIDLAQQRKVKTLLALPHGVARDLEISFDGKKILFSMRRDAKDDYHLYELNADGTGLRQLTHGSGLSDIDPIYLPDGKILFTSTREPKYCMCNRHIMGNLFTMNADGTDMQQIGHSTLHEGHPSLLPDGRVIYDRWEYVDRNFGDAQGTWVVNPDGTNHAIYWGNNTNSPGGVLDARPVPGTELFISTFGACHDRPWGAIALVDRRLGLDGKTPVLRTWPADARKLVGVGNYDTVRQVSPKYEDPYPLDEQHFLCSRMTGRGEQMGIYLIDMLGNEDLVHTEGTGCFDPMPLAQRLRPPVIPSRIDLAKSDGNFYVENVYIGSGMERIEPGTVKYLRVVESPEKRFWTKSGWDGGTGQQAPGMAWDDFNNKRIIGTVPVESDGSVYFKVPSERFVYFQLLDERGRMVQSMRSGTIVRPGETSGCVGCHENRRSTPALDSSIALQQGTRPLVPWHGPPRLFSYTAEVQPVFDKHCVSCHDYGKDEGKKLNLAGDLGLVFNTSYVELRDKGHVSVVGAGPHSVQMPKTWGSHVSRLAKVMLEGHGNSEIDAKVKLCREDIDRVITWIDINAPYYPDYSSGAFYDHPYGRSPLDWKQLKRLSVLTGLKLIDVRSADLKHTATVNFTRPELSTCLQRFADINDPKYKESLALINFGRERLKRDPRPDMPGYRLVNPVEVKREKRYQDRLQDENNRRKAIISDRRLDENCAK